MFVLLLLIGAAALLPITGVYANASCDWKSEGPAPGGGAPLSSVSLSLRAPDAAVGAGLRQRIEAGLKAGGVADVVDNPLSFPRAQVTVTEMDGRWTPFWATLKLKTNVIVDRKKDRKGADVSVDVVVEGSCRGLVNSDQWRDSALDVLAKDVIAHIAPKP